jgi:hypothetical protein
MKTLKNALPFLLFALGFGLAAAACAGEPVEVTVPVEVTRQVVVTRIVTEEVIVEVTPVPGPEVPYEELWATSGHADVSAEAFRHWDAEDPAVVPANCAKCHTPDGYMDFLGADGTAFGAVDAESHLPAAMGITCVACHNEVTADLTSVVMPSGVELTGLGDEARCMQCHQGRSSSVTVNAAIEEAGVGDDEVSEDLGFINIHYYAAAATKYGTVAQGGYQYEGKTYDGYFAHVDGYTSCIGCHDPHTLEIKVAECQSCHGDDVETAEDFKDVRMPGSLVDYDGDGDVEEGIYYEIEGVQEVLYAALQEYAASATGVGIVYNPDAYPYWFDEAGERYASWTPRLLRAAYNFQVSHKDTGAYAHGGKYIIQLLYDSIEDLNPEMAAGLQRIDNGHFAGSEEAFRHWDEDGFVPGSCSRCHSAEGLPLYLTQAVSINQPVANGFQCATCHNDLETWSRYTAAAVTFPSGLVVELEEGSESGLCMSCHQGRESTASVNKSLGDNPGDTVVEGLRFRNIHYFAAGATVYGTEAQGAYQFEGNEYVGYNEHAPAANECVECHNTHTQQVDPQVCANCHEGVDTLEAIFAIRMSEVDYDGDGDVTEGLYGEITTMRDALYAAMQAYTASNGGTAVIVYNAHAYPYYFDDAGKAYATWTPNLLRAAYNYQYSQKDPGAFAHNGKYLIQILYDSIQIMGGDVSGMTRP